MLKSLMFFSILMISCSSHDKYEKYTIHQRICTGRVTFPRPAKARVRYGLTYTRKLITACSLSTENISCDGGGTNFEFVGDNLEGIKTTFNIEDQGTTAVVRFLKGEDILFEQKYDNADISDNSYLPRDDGPELQYGFTNVKLEIRLPGEHQEKTQLWDCGDTLSASGKNLDRHNCLLAPSRYPDAQIRFETDEAFEKAKVFLIEGGVEGEALDLDCIDTSRIDEWYVG